MCELLGFTSTRPMLLNEYLREFYSHSPFHPDGWGLALLEGRDAEIEKEPLQASKSRYLQQRLTVPIQACTALAHIRYATIGNVEYRNCHPFTGHDSTGRRWTLMHNGTIFDYPPMNPLINQQLGDTDSERILLYLLENMQDPTATARQRFYLLDRLICAMAPGNKLNLLLYDGELLYVHTNYPGSLHCLQEEGRLIFSTKLLGRGNWQPVPMNTLLACREGAFVFTGTNHGATYRDSTENMQYLYQIFSGL